MTHVAVVLSGCGFMDGSEIHESVLCLLALSQERCTYQCFAPNSDQTVVMNHLTQEAQAEKRNALVEAARIARGDIHDLSELDPSQFDAILLPGGAGAATTLCNYLEKGADCTVHDKLKSVLLHFHEEKKPIGACCIAPAAVGKSFEGVAKVKLTLGSTPKTYKQVEDLGMHAESARIHEVVADTENKIFTTPCYMEPPNLAAMYEGVRNMVQQLKAAVIPNAKS